MPGSKSFIFLLCICLMFYACVEPYELGKQQEKKVLTVDATITDLAEEQTVKIIESVSADHTLYALPVTKAKVEIVVNGTERVILTERGGGIYVLPVSFHTQVGNRYKLVFERENGSRYESAEERQSVVSDITSIYDEFRVDGIDRGFVTIPAHYIYLDSDDPANEKNNYMWTWKLWESQSICATCLGGRFFTNPAPARCRIETGFSNVAYDYNCNGLCWDILYNTDLNVFSDVFSNGRPIVGRLIAKIPFYANHGALLEVKQQSISPDAYQYMKLLVNQVQNNGSLVDTPPAAIIGNIKNVNNNTEAIAGFFMVTSVRTKKYWLSRANASGLAAPVGLLDHAINYEPSTGDPSRPPAAPCDESKNRTRFEPEGWIN